MREMLRKEREDRERMESLDREMERHHREIQEHTNKLVENHLSTIVLSIHVGDKYPLRPRHVFVPPATEGFLPIIDTADTHFFEVGLADADYASVHFCHGTKNTLIEARLLQECALRYVVDRLDDYDVVVMTDSENYMLDVTLLTQRMQYVLARPMQYKQGWGAMETGRWALTTQYLKKHLLDNNLETRKKKEKDEKEKENEKDLPNPLIWSKHHNHPLLLMPRLLSDMDFLMPGITNYLIPLVDRSDGVRRRAENRIMYKNGVTFHVNHHVFERHEPECVYPVALILVVQQGEMKVAAAIREVIMKTFTCRHDIFLVDNGSVRELIHSKEGEEGDEDVKGVKGVKVDNDSSMERSSSEFVSVRLHSKRSTTYAMRMGVRAADAIGKLKRRAFSGYGFIDGSRLDFINDNSLEFGWLTKLMDQMFVLPCLFVCFVCGGNGCCVTLLMLFFFFFSSSSSFTLFFSLSTCSFCCPFHSRYKIDAVAIHPVLSYESSTKYTFMKTQTRVATKHYRHDLDESSCCRQVWILGNSVLSVLDAEFFKTSGGMDVAIENAVEGLELEWSYWSRKLNKKMLVSESIVVVRQEKEVISQVAGDNNEEKEMTEDQDEEQKERKVWREKEMEKEYARQRLLCTVFQNSFGTSMTKWPDVLLYGGGAEDVVSRLATSNGKQVLYKPTGNMLNKLMKSHQKPSIDDVKAEWLHRCFSKEVEEEEEKKKTNMRAAAEGDTKRIVMIGGVPHDKVFASPLEMSGSSSTGVYGLAADVILLLMLIILVGVYRYVTRGKRKKLAYMK